MRRDAGAPVPSFPLPDGYKYAFYSDGDETSWARIEASVLEFDSEFAALMHFKQEFVPYGDELRRRCIFVENSDGEKVATSTAWWAEVEGQRRPWLHWVAAVPSYQGLGLGKAIAARATNLLLELEGDVPIYLKTQTWSYKAVGIYKACGYEPTDEKALYKARRHDYKKALRILKQLEKKSINNLG
jgi:GNAT superfamily N-acetyltransferase